METHQNISTTSTASETNANLNSDQKDKAKKIEHPTFILSTNKKYKNLVHCYLCRVEDCQKLFKTNQELIEHKKSHTQIHTCPINGCNKSFKEIINLRKHYKHHFPTEKRYYCPFEGCGKSFTASYNLTIHYRIHKLICQHKNCNHKSKSIKQKLMHHDKLEEFCIREKNLLLNLVMAFQKNIVCLLKLEKNKIDEDIKKNVNIIINKSLENNFEDNKLINEIKEFTLDEDLKEDLNNILLQSKVVFSNAINQDQYQDLVDDCKK